MANINVNRPVTVSLASAAKLISRFGHKKSYVLRGEPGIGKTQTLKTLKKMLSTHDAIYIDCPTLDVPDVGMGIPDRDTKQIEFYINAVFKLVGEGSKRPKIIMLDELAKCRGPVLLAFARLLLERILCGIALPEGSIVFATSNNASDGVGDSYQSHLVNRVCLLDILKPCFDDWNDWAVNDEIDEVVLTWAGQNPTVFNSYKDYEGMSEHDFSKDDARLNTRPFIFNPSTPGIPFVSPRSLAQCSPTVTDRHSLTRDEFLADLAGTIGLPAAKHMVSFIDTLGKLVHFEDIIADPDGVPCVTTGVMASMQINMGINRIKTVNELEKFLRFVNRMAGERKDLRSLFFRRAQKSERLAKLMAHNNECRDWAASKEADAMI